MGGGIYVPTALIIGYNSAAAAPDGWVNFNSADGRAIFGGSTDGDIGLTGGDTGFALTSSSNGSHTGSRNIGCDNYRDTSGDTYPSQGKDLTGFGNHNHSVTCSYNPKRNNVRLIRASVDLKELPANGILFSSGASIEGCSSFDTFNNNASAVLYAAAATGTQAASSSYSVNTKSASHDHQTAHNGSRFDASIATYTNAAAMSHNHTFSWSATPNLNRVVMRAWLATELLRKNAGGIVALYNGAGVPDKWVLCNGANGTVNLNNYFIYNNGTAGSTVNGGNKISASGSLPNKGHSHSYGGSPVITGSVIAHSSQDYHSHTASGSPSWYPNYYKLKFVQYIG